MVNTAVVGDSDVMHHETERARSARVDAGIRLEGALDRFVEALDEPIAATGADALHAPDLCEQLTSRWAGYVPG